MVRKSINSNRSIDDSFFDDRIVLVKLWYQKSLYWIAIILSLVWMYLSLDYFVYAGWWENRYEFSPGEFVGIFSSQFLPLALIWFVVAWIERRAQMQQETAELRGYMSQLMMPSEQGAVYTKTLTNALREQIQEFKIVFEQVAEQTDLVREDLKIWLQDLAVVIDHADKQTVESIKEMARHVQLLAKSTEKANDSTKKITDSLEDRARILQGTSEKVAHVMGGVSGILEENRKAIENVTQSIHAAVDKAGLTMTRADAASGQLQQHADRLEAVFDKYDAQTRISNDRLFENAEKILTVMKKQGALLDEEMAKTRHQLDVASNKAADQAQALYQLSDRAIHHLSDTGNQFAVQTELMNQALADTDQKIKQLAKLGIESQVDHLVQASEKAQKYFGGLKADLENVQTDQFMKDARLILEHLSAFSIDIAHVFEPKAEEDLWKKYYAGDNMAFMRYLISALPEKKANQVKSLFEKDAAVRIAMTRYMAEFDVLAAKARESDNKSVLLPMLIGSDAGRLYMILKQIVGKKGGEA